MQRVNLTESFYLDEFTRSTTAARMGREIVVELSSEIHSNILHLTSAVLQPLRTGLGAVVTVLSGWRPDWLNVAVGGSKTSDHLDALAADIIVAGYTPFEVCQYIERERLPFKQLIHEFGRWSHVSVLLPGVTGNPPRQCLTAYSIDGTTHYLNDIHPIPRQKVA